MLNPCNLVEFNVFRACLLLGNEFEFHVVSDFFFAGFLKFKVIIFFFFYGKIWKFPGLYDDQM